jgi:hypothetical protein
MLRESEVGKACHSVAFLCFVALPLIGLRNQADKGCLPFSRKN